VASNDFRGSRIHMVGIGGCGMSGLAAILLRRGAIVTGTDNRESAELTRLAGCGARVSTRQTAEAVPEELDLVVASAAIPDDHPELQAARARGVRALKYAQMLGRVMARYDGVAVAGTHGKSTTTAWLAYTLRLAGLDPSFVVGATAGQLGGGSGVGDGPHFIAEACEYDRSFLNLSPRRAVILNIEEDHLDCYPNLAAIRDAFERFAALVPRDGLLVLNGQDARCRAIASSAACRVETFGVGGENAWQPANLSLTDGVYSFEVLQQGSSLGRVTLGISGRHNVYNGLAVAALARDCGVQWPAIRDALATFRGAQRRLELRGTRRGVRVVDDYAHHPTEIQATLQAARERYTPRRLWCIFQPHQHSRTRFLMADFARSFELADRVVVPDIYFVRDSERERERVSARDLVEQIRDRGGDAAYVPEFQDIVELVAENARDGDVVLTMGAGNIWNVADELLARLGE
jgi:UDP-N-acetylmuramate--alanine ligase